MWSSLRRPEYTGEDRCVRCTAVNIFLTVAAATLAYVSGATLMGFYWGLLSMATVLAVGFLAIYLRGYLIPYTPALTRRLMPESALAVFGKDATGTRERGEIEGVLTAADAVEFSGDLDDLVLTPEFEEAWLDAIDDVPEDVEHSTVLQALGFDEEDEDVRIYRGRGESESPLAVEVVDRGATLAKWPSETALQVDLASANLLRDRVEQWDEEPPEWRARVVRGLRLFLDRCPDGEEVVESSEVVPSCCSRKEVVSLSCGESGARLLEQEI